MVTPLLLAATLFSLPAAAATQSIYYVDPTGSDGNPGTQALPFQTLDKARQAVAAVNKNMTGDVLVYLRGGIYSLVNTVVFGPGDSGTNGFKVVYQAYPGERPRLSGGQLISGWSSAGNGIYKASNVAFDFRQLYVNDRRAVRARTPNTGSYYQTIGWLPKNETITKKSSRWLQINASEISNWPGLNAVEAVIERSWDVARMRISSYSISGATATLTFASPENTTSEITNFAYKWDGSKYFFENAMAFLDDPGEWFLNTATRELFYIPRSGEDIHNVVVVAPRLETLISLQGSAGTPVHHIQFQGLTFEYTTWMSPSVNGFWGFQGGWSFDYGIGVYNTMPGGVRLTYTNNVRFERDVFQHMGGQGLQLDLGDVDDVVSGSVVADISGNGISVESMKAISRYEDVLPTPQQVCRGDTIVDNRITDTAQDYWGGVAIFAGYPDSLTVRNNEISHLRANAISVGWGWRSDSTPLRNNIIRANHIHHVCLDLQDCGAIYVMSSQPDSVITENYVHDVHMNPVIPPLTGADLTAAVYLDSNSDYFTVSNNVSMNVVTRPIFDPQVTNNNIFLNPYGTHNNFVNNAGQSPTVIAAAGLEPAYQDILAAGSAATVATLAVSASGLNLRLTPQSSPILSLTVNVPPGAFPAGTIVALNADVGYLLPRVASNEAALAQWQSGLGFGLSAGGLQPYTPVSVVLKYDPLQLPPGASAKRLQLARYDDASSQWTLVPTAVDTAQNTITSSVAHFSLYAPLMVAAGSDLSSLQVFPQPWEIGDPASAYWAQTLTFSGLPASSSVKIFTLAGELVWQGTASAGGVLTWDGGSRFGRKAVSGTYYAAFESGGAKRIRRVVIVR